MIILKFGGTSVNTKNRIEVICSIVREQKSQQPVVVVSALRGVTDLLFACISASKEEQKTSLRKIKNMHFELIDAYYDEEARSDIRIYISEYLKEVEVLLTKERRDKAMTDRILSYGERLSSTLIAHALNSVGIQSQSVLATELIITTDEFGSADFLPDQTEERIESVLLPLLNEDIVPVVTGFIGATERGEVTTLGRGGSDYSAAIIGYCLKASEIQIWTDVDGIYSADPRLVTNAMRIPHVSFREASELAAFGAKVLHPRTIRPAVSQGIPVRVVSILRPESYGTIISNEGRFGQRITAVASKPTVTLVTLYSTEMLFTKGFLKRIFAVFEKYAISVDLVSVSEVSVSVTLDNDDQLEQAIHELGKFTVVTTKEMGMVSLIGEGIVFVPHIMRDIFTTLDTADIAVHMISLGASEINISLIVSPLDVIQAVLLLHNELIAGTQSERKFI